MKVRDILSEESKKNLKEIRLNEKLTTREWKELMGVNRDTYKRVNGSVRRK